MIRNKKAMLFCSQMILAGALITGAPCLASGDNGETSVFGSSDTNAEDEVSDLSGEGQIHKPASLNAPDFTSDPNFVDDSTDNTYGYYTIMGTTTVSLAQMTSQYNAHGSEYPSASLKEGGRRSQNDQGTWRQKYQMHVCYRSTGRTGTSSQRASGCTDLCRTSGP